MAPRKPFERRVIVRALEMSELRYLLFPLAFGIDAVADVGYGTRAPQAAE